MTTLSNIDRKDITRAYTRKLKLDVNSEGQLSAARTKRNPREAGSFENLE
ncbi:MAG: hypothetical protein ABI866_06965 [Dokdonella sp.]